MKVFSTHTDRQTHIQEMTQHEGVLNTHRQTDTHPRDDTTTQCSQQQTQTHIHRQTHRQTHTDTQPRNDTEQLDGILKPHTHTHTQTNCDIEITCRWHHQISVIQKCQPITAVRSRGFVKQKALPRASGSVKCPGWQVLFGIGCIRA